MTTSIGIDHIAVLYREARELAKNGDNVHADRIAHNLLVISEYCMTLYSRETVYGRAKVMARVRGFVQIAEIIRRSGLKDPRVEAFFCFSSQSVPQGTLPSKRDSVPSAGSPDGKGKNVEPVPPSPEAKDEPDPLDSLLFGMQPPAPAAPPGPADDLPDTGSADESKTPPVSPAEATEPPAPAPLSDDCLPSGTPDGAADSPAVRAPLRPTFSPETLDDFIGQEHVIKRIKEEVVAAHKQGRAHIDHILLLGNKGLGKTTLMKLIAKELGVRLELMDASQFSNDVRSQRAVQKFLERISERDEPVIIAFDEIHALPKHIQTGLLTLLSEGVYSYLDTAGIVHNLPIREFTFLGATTDAQDLLPTLKDRCSTLTFYLKDYSPENLAQIFVNKFASVGLTAEEPVLEQCINRCRSSIREVDAFVKGLKTKAVLRDVTEITLDMATEYFRDVDRDPIGLKTTDIQILKAIHEEASGMISEDTLAARVHMDPKVLTHEFEPYLLKIGFVSISSRGRSLTEKGLAYVNAL